MTTPNLENINVSPSTRCRPGRDPRQAAAFGQGGNRHLGREACATSSTGKDHRLFVVVGPVPSIDPVAASTTPAASKKLADEVRRHAALVMRVYSKNRAPPSAGRATSTIPDMDDSFRSTSAWKRGSCCESTNSACRPAPRRSTRSPAVIWRPDRLDGHRRPHHRIADPPRNVVRPVHPGRLQERHQRRPDVAVNQRHPVGLPPAQLPRHQQQGRVAIIRTTGNAYGHVVLRGGGGWPELTPCPSPCRRPFAKAKLPANIVVDCSHANSSKKPELQPLVIPTWPTRSAAATSPSSA